MLFIKGKAQLIFAYSIDRGFASTEEMEVDENKDLQQRKSS